MFTNFIQKIANAQCDRCMDTGIWLSPRHEVLVCPRVQMGETHVEPNAASLLLRRTCNRLFEQKAYINSQCFDLARVLTNYSSETPCQREWIYELFFADTNFTEANKLRKFHSLIEELQKVWLLPVGARKHDPHGYWIITDLADFKQWINHAKSAPITRLSTLHKVAKHNFPIFAEQMELEFWKDLGGDDDR